MPPCDAVYLLNWLFEAGPVTQNGMGGAPLSFLEIQAWQQCTGVELNAFEARVLRALSVAYLSESHAATKRDRAAPWRPESKPDFSSVQVALRALAQAQ